MTTRRGRQSAFRRVFSVSGTGLELMVAPGSDPSLNRGMPALPDDGVPAGLDGRLLVLGFTSELGLDTLTPARIGVQGGAVRWLAAPADLATTAGGDGDLAPADVAWLTALAATLSEGAVPAGRWRAVLAEAPLPGAVALALAQADDDTDPGDPLPGFEPDLSALALLRAATTVVAAPAWLNAIDRVLVADRSPFVSERLRQRILLVAFENPFAVGTLTGESLQITGGNRIPEVPVRWAWPLDGIDGVAAVDTTLTAAERARLAAIAAGRAAAGDIARWLVVCTDSRGDFSTYSLSVVNDPRFDALLSSVPVLLKIDCLDGFDCKTPTAAPGPPEPAPDLDYLTRDYAGFRQLMLDRLARLGAADPAPNIGGLWSVLVEAMAYRADQLAQMQDAVATEAYLHTARLRPSVKRHARLLDYRMHEGVTARAWLHVRAAPGVDRTDGIAVGDVALTRLAGAPAVLPIEALATGLPEGTEVFHVALPPRRISAAHNRIAVYTWGEDDLVLLRGATRCTLHDPGGLIRLEAGDTLVFETVAGAQTGLEEDADPTLRHVVRLSALPSGGTDTLLDQGFLDIEWAQDDALPFDLEVRRDGRELAVARGNLCLAGHGRPAEEEIALAAWGSRGGLRAELSRKDLCWTTPAPRWDGDWSANAVVRQAPEDALPDLTLEAGETWRPRPDLLASDRSAAEFCVEMENDGTARLRFGNDITGRSPAIDTRFTARYRVGSGTAGNVGADTIAHLLSDTMPAEDIEAMRNPVPAAGGTAPETIAEARAAAPYAFRRQERAVTLADWAEVATRGGTVQRAVARLRWTGSWHNVRVHVDPSDARPADAAFTAAMERELERYRMAGLGLQVVGPVYVPLDIALSVCVEADVWPDAVAETLVAEFGAGRLPDGRLGFFHPDNFTFGDSVFLSQIVARAMAVPGVRWVDSRTINGKNRFRRWSSTAPDALESGVLAMGELEVPQCQSDPSTPDKGRIAFVVEGGA
jgi:hypothetical protein